MAAALLLFSFGTTAATYYVDAESGDDMSDGLTTDTAWRSVDRVSGTAFAPGDQILFKRGQTWYSRINVTSSGTEGSPITYGAYGSGAAPIFDGASGVTGWSDAGDGRYSATVTPRPELVVFADVKGSKQDVLEDVDEELEWYWDADTLTVYSPSEPTDIEVSSTMGLVVMFGKSYVTVRDLALRHANYCVAVMDSNYVILDNLDVYDNVGPGGISIMGTQAGKGEHNTVRYCEVSNTSGSVESLACDNAGDGIFIYPEYCNYNVVTHNTVSYSGHDGISILGGSHCTVSHNVVTESAQSGIRIGSETSSANVIEFNTVYQNCREVDDRCAIDLLRVGNDNIVRYNVTHDQYNLPEGPLGSAGIRFDGGDWVDHDFMDSTGNTACYNLVYNEGRGIESFNFSNVHIYNNTVVNTRFLGITIESYSLTAVSSDNVVMNNIVCPLSGYAMFNSVSVNTTCDYNCYFPDGATSFYFDMGIANLDSWRTVTGQDSHSFAAWPEFTDAPALDFSLQPGSPCVDQGVALGLTRDFDGVPVPQGLGVDIGALEVDMGTEGEGEGEGELALISPNGGEIWACGAAYTITWSDPFNTAGDSVRLALHRHGALVDWIVRQTENDGSYGWIVWDDLEPGDEYSIRVQSYANPDLRDYSDAYFTVEPVAVLSPNGGEVWTMGDFYTITWAGNPAIVGADVRIALHKGFGFVDWIVRRTENDGKYSWKVPADLEEGSGYRIRVQAYDDDTVRDYGDDTFLTILPPLLWLSPERDNVWLTGEERTATWQCNDLEAVGPDVRIALHRGGAFVDWLVRQTPNDGEWAWSIPEGIEPAASYRLRLQSYTDKALRSMTAAFTIAE
ncbi:MAG TPA: Ser-Thr-rich GPI-anchored membrane family protein [Candidatus Hydrogenedentes bacterium]|nr:Ser-Thr-rich GPI-anchored membrane family protein [Candidatus Hydrogenedentota bacterium]